MKTKDQIQEEIEARERLGRANQDNAPAQASVQGQIDVLMWASNYECTVTAPEYA